MKHYVSTVPDSECLSVEGTLCKSELLAFRFVDLVARRYALEAIGVEPLRILTLPWIDACRKM